MASKISILRKFFDDILKKEPDYYCDISRDYIFRFRYCELKYSNVITKNYSLTVMEEGSVLPFVNPILFEPNDNHLYVHRKQICVDEVEDFISNSDEELVLAYGRGILDSNIIQIINNSGVNVDLDDFSNFLQGIKI